MLRDLVKARPLQQHAAAFVPGQGAHAGANPISGDFSLSAKGVRIRGGKLAEPVTQITVSGNFYRMLESVQAVGKDLKFGVPGASAFGTPSLLVERLDIAGKDE